MTQQTAPSPRLTGEVISWSDLHGYGFVRRDDGESNIFLHISDANLQLRTGTRVEFSIGEDRRGRQKAVQVVSA